jgi:hypothetical protein
MRRAKRPKQRDRCTEQPVTIVEQVLRSQNEEAEDVKFRKDIKSE